MAKAKSWYMHTIDGRPAAFQKESRGGGCLCYIGRWHRGAVLVPDLDTIRAQQRMSRESYARDGIEPGQYDYIVFPRGGR